MKIMIKNKKDQKKVKNRGKSSIFAKNISKFRIFQKFSKNHINYF